MSGNAESVMDDIAIKRLQDFCDGERGPYTNLAADLRFALDELKSRAVRERVLSAERNRAQTACEQIGARLATVRASAMEEAAKVCDGYEPRVEDGVAVHTFALAARHFAKSIRALKEPA